MDSELFFRIVLAVKSIAYIVPRFYYRRKAARANPSGESELRNVSESKLRLALMGVSGLGADLSHPTSGQSSARGLKAAPPTRTE